MYEMLKLVESSLENNKKTIVDGNTKYPEQVREVQSMLLELRDQMDKSSESSMKFIDDLRHCSANPGSNYYWVIFVVLYGGFYLLQ